MRAPVPRGLFTALELLRSPSMADVLRQQAALPDDIGIVIRVAGGCEETVGPLADQLDKPEALLIKAARFYLEQVLFYSETDSYRILGLSPDASQQEIREHGRWMLRWLHPDNDHSEWEAAFAGRVANAWNDLKTPARRQEYDRTLTAQRARAFRRRPPVHLALPLITRPERERGPAVSRGAMVRFAAASAVFLCSWLIPFDGKDPLPSDRPLASCAGANRAAAMACDPSETASAAVGTTRAD